VNTLRTIRIVLWGAVALLAFIVGAVTLAIYTDRRETPQVASVGGPFTLVDHNGKRVTERDLLGKPSLVFFGFTHCPDVCPTTLYEASGWLEALGRKAEGLNITFVSVDPERDTVPVLAEYMKSFPGIRGLTGTPEEVAGAAKAYRIYSRKVPTEGGYTMDHSAAVLMMTASGDFFGTITPQESKEQALAKLKRLLG